MIKERQPNAVRKIAFLHSSFSPSQKDRVLIQEKTAESFQYIIFFYLLCVFQSST